MSQMSCRYIALPRRTLPSQHASKFSLTLHVLLLPNHLFVVSHLLIKSKVSRNPVSRRTNKSTEGVTAEDAIAELTEYAAKINAEGCTEDVFSKYCKERSDCGSFQNGGDLGMFGPGAMQKQFEDGTKATPVGKMSDIVQSDSGHHLIFRTA